MVEAFPPNQEADYNILTIYDPAESRWIYLLIFVVQRLVTTFFYAWGLKVCIEVGHPKYYKPSSWMSDKI